MKKCIIIILMMMGCFSQSHAQNFVTDTKGFVISQLDSLGVNYMFGTNAEGLEYFYFLDGIFEIQYVFDNTGYCIYYKIIFPKGGIEPMSQSLDDSFERISENQWQEFDGREHFVWSTELMDESCIITVQTKVRFDLNER